MHSLKRFVGFGDERVLLSALKQGNAMAVEFWFRKYCNKIKKIALSRLPSDCVAQEIVQETFINCLQTINLFKGKSSLLTWMQSVLRHEIADYYRKLYAKKIICITPLGDLLLATDTRDAAGTAEKVAAVLHQMLGKNRELLLSKYVDRLSVKEIARRWRLSDKAVESDLFRARREFKALWLSSKIDGNLC